ncbi:MAG: benzoate-CoA ligase family protein [Acidobacteriota bacterium]
MVKAQPVTGNIAHLFLDRRLQDGDAERVALHLVDGDWTYREVHAAAEALAAELRRRGVGRGDRVLIAQPDGAEYVASLFAILKVGAVVVMLNPRLQEETLRFLFDQTAAPWALIHPEVEGAFRRAADGADHHPELLLLGGAAGWPCERPPEAESTTLAVAADEPALWLFSGGTTGFPKAVVQPHRSFANTTELYAQRALGYRRDDVTLAVPKLYFGYATGSALFFPFSVGAATVLFAEHPTAAILFDLIARFRPSILINVPTMIGQMLGDPGAGERDLSCLRFATSAGEALPVPLYERWRDTFGVELLDGLGTAEMWHVFLSNLPGAVRPGTLGRCVPGFEIKVCNDAGAEVPAGQVGRLWVRGASRALEYWRNPEKTEQAFRGDWFIGGDLVCRDDDGYVTYCGRGDDSLKVGGKWLAPQEVESCLMRHPQVEECAVVGIENAAGLVKPCAVVRVRSPRPGLEDDLKAHVLAHLEPYKHPRRVVLVEDFPRTHLGKIDRGALKRSLSQAQ